MIEYLCIVVGEDFEVEIFGDVVLIECNCFVVLI